MIVAAVVPAAGVGRRLGGRTSKLFVPLGGVPLLAHTLCALQASPAIRWILPVVRSHERRRVEGLLRRYGITKALPPCAGGESRAESVARGVAAAPAQAEWILVHDGARPCVSLRLIAQAVRAAARHGAVICGTPAALTVKAVDGAQEVRLTLDREHLWFAQTPQVFRRDWLARALEGARGRFASFPDDASMVEAAGFPVRIIQGDPLNLKVTTREDLVLAEAIVTYQQREGASPRGAAWTAPLGPPQTAPHAGRHPL